MKKCKLNITVLSDEELSPNDIIRALDALNVNFTYINKMTTEPATKSECKNIGKNTSNCNIQSGSNYCKQCGKSIPDGFRFCSSECKQYYYR